MPDIKRLNYFTSQFLVEKDFDDEQAYHLTARRRHNRILHTSGVADGLDVTPVGGAEVQVGAGTAIDREGREIVLNDPLTYALVPGGNDQDVYLTIAYHEDLDAVDEDAEFHEFTRTTERPLLQHGTAAPPTEGSVLVLARIHLNGSGAIESIDTTVRTLGSAKVAPRAVATAQLADGAVTLAKLANEVKPLSVQGTDAITIVTDDTLKQLVVGETHSARTDNPHGTTAVQVDNHGGANRLVAQINAGTGIIARSRLESAITSGVVTFENLAAGVELLSDDIDPGFGPGPVSIELSSEDVPNAGFTSTGDPTSDTSATNPLVFRSVVDRTTGLFRIFVARDAGSPTASAAIRWTAFKPAEGSHTTVAIGVTVNPPTATLISSSRPVLTASVTNTSSTGVIWSIAEATTQTPGAGGTLSISGNSATYTPPGLSGTYHVVATSVADGTRTGTAALVVNADVTVTLTQTSATVFGGSTLLNLGATVVNTPSTGVNWSILEGPTVGSLSSSTGPTVNYTAPLAAGNYHVVATSVADATKTATCEIFVPAVTISINRTAATVFRNETLSLNATVGNTDTTGVSWSTTGGAVAVTTGSSAIFTAPSGDGTFTVTAISVADPTKKATCQITVPVVTIAISAGNTTLQVLSSTTITASITGTNDNRATWTGPPLTLSSSVGPTTTFFAPSSPNLYTVTAKSVADPTQSRSITFDVQDAPSKAGPTVLTTNQLQPVAENIATGLSTSTSETAPSMDEMTDDGATARSFVRPEKRSSPKRRPKRSDD
jgi:hypothetical protein